jgi:hypothetical protein
MTQGRSYLAGLVTGVAVTAIVGVIGMSVASARGGAQAPAATKMSAPAVKVLLENNQATPTPTRTRTSG